MHEAGWFEPALRDTLTTEFYEHIAPRTERAVHAASHVITPSQASRRDLVRACERRGADAPYVLYAAMLHPRKNLALLRELPGAPDRVVRLCDPTNSEIAALMAGADAFRLPSLYEGFGLTVAEAMACGRAGRGVRSGRAAGGRRRRRPRHRADGARAHRGVESILTEPAKAAQLSRAVAARAA